MESDSAYPLMLSSLESEPVAIRKPAIMMIMGIMMRKKEEATLHTKEGLKWCLTVDSGVFIEVL